MLFRSRSAATKFMDSLKLAAIVTHVADARTCGTPGTPPRRTGSARCSPSSSTNTNGASASTGHRTCSSRCWRHTGSPTFESPEVIQPDMSYENIKDNLTLRLVELKRNRMYLVNVPYMTVGNGLALVCDIRVNSGEEGFWRTTVNKEMMAENNYDKKQMFTAALADAEKIEPPVMVDMAGKLFGANGHTNVLTDAAAITPEDKSDMYILSNQSGVLGT